jgi:hypothetical protein
MTITCQFDEQAMAAAAIIAGVTRRSCTPDHGDDLNQTA